MGARRRDPGRPRLQSYVLPAAVVILLVLFALQPLGTAKIDKAFGPVMLPWFTAMALLGVYGIARHPVVVAAVAGLLLDQLGSGRLWPRHLPPFSAFAIADRNAYFRASVVSMSPDVVSRNGVVLQAA